MSTQGSTKSNPKLRRIHTKSRAGCKECKRRHIKCDEGRPHCVNCSVSKRQCEYALALPLFARTPHVSPTLNSRHAYVDSATSPNYPVAEPLFECRHAVYDSGGAFSLQHMQLLHHVEHGVTTWLGGTSYMVPLVQQYIKTALTVPYLMDQLLALSAQHLSHSIPQDSDHYNALAAELQTRGLSLFNSIGSNTDGTARWFYSSLLAVHRLATTLVKCQQQDFDAFLDNLITHMGLHQGSTALGSSSWETIRTSGLQDWLETIDSPATSATTPSADKPHMFIQMLQSSHLNAASIDACRKAHEALEFLWGRVHEPNSWGPHAAMAWPNLIPEDFIRLLRNRVPESLVLLVLWAELVHNFRSFWVFGEAGEVLIRGLASRLGTFWAKWLTGPLAALEQIY